MSATTLLDNAPSQSPPSSPTRTPKRGPFTIAPLGPETAPRTIEPGNWIKSASRAGVLVSGGCGFNGSTLALWGPLGDVAAISHGPVGCGHYALAARRAPAGRMNGIDAFAHIHFTTDFQEKDVIFGGDKKLAKCLDELNMLFPMAKGASVLAECPVGLIGDDIEAVAREKRAELGMMVAPVHCEGFRTSGDLVMRDTRKQLRNEGKRAEPIESTPYDVSIMCFDTGYGHAKIARELMEAIGLRVVAQWPGNSSAMDMGRMSKAKLIVVPNVGSVKNVYATGLEKDFGVPSIEVVIHSPNSIDAALRAVAARFDDKIKERAEAVIAANRSRIDKAVEKYRPRLAGKLYFALGILAFHIPAPFQELGMRVGTTFQGWPDRDGNWRTLPKPYLYRTLTDNAVALALTEAEPDLISSLSAQQDDRFLRKWGYQPFDWFVGQGGVSYWGYDGFIRLAEDLDLAINSPWRKLIAAPW